MVSHASLLKDSKRPGIKADGCREGKLLKVGSKDPNRDSSYVEAPSLHQLQLYPFCEAPMKEVSCGATAASGYLELEVTQWGLCIGEVSGSVVVQFWTGLGHLLSGPNKSKRETPLYRVCSSNEGACLDDVSV